MAARGRPRTFDRQEALQSAVDVFLARGYDGATLEDLTSAMGGIAPPSFYAAFESKDNLFREAIELYASTAGSHGREALGGPRVREAIEGMLRASTDAFTVPDKPGGCLALLGAVGCTRATKETHEFLQTVREQPPLLNGLALRARDGASRELLHAAIDGAMAAWKTLTAPAKPPKPLKFVKPSISARRSKPARIRR
jgi:AcrR family transcriptional regulator